MKKITFLFLMMFAMSWQSQSQVTIGTANDGGSSSSTPINPYYAFSYSQTIYLASEIGASGNITSLDFQLNPGTSISSADDNVDVWIGTTSKTSFESITDWVPVSGLTQVLTNGTITAAGDVLTIAFSAPFAYNGTDNLIVAVDANEVGFGSNSDYVFQTTGPANSSLYQRSDTTNSDPNSPVSGTLKATRGNITINGITQACTAPSGLTASNIASTSADLSWTENGSSSIWDIELVDITASETQTGTPTVSGVTNPYALTELILGHSYQFYVRSDCGDSKSPWAGPLGFTTIPPPPANDACSGANEVNSLPYSFSQTDAADSTNNDGFITVCLDGMNDGLWFTFTPITEGTVNILLTNVASSFDPQMNLYSGSCDALDCEITTDDGTEGEDETLTAYAVTAGVQYFVNVGDYGQNTDDPEGNFDIQVTGTFTLGVNDFENINNFTYFPNPVNNTLNLKAQTSIQNVSIYNMLGQEVAKISPNALDSEVDMSALQIGAYFVKVTINDATETIRVIKQ